MVTGPIRTPASSGVGWVIKSLTLVKLQFAPLLLIAVLMQMILGLAQVPLLGLLIVLSVPVLSAGMLQAFHQAAEGMRPMPTVLFRAFTLSPHRARLLMTGALVFAVGFVCILFGVSGINELQDPLLLQRLEQGDMNAVYELGPATLSRIVLAFAIGVSVSGTLSFFTVPLVWFHDLALGQSLALGIKGLLGNWKPLLMLAIGLLIVLFPVLLVVSLVMGMAVSGGWAGTLGTALIVLIAVSFQLVLFGVQYCCAREVFPFIEPDKESEPGDEDPKDDDQLLV